MTHTQMPDRIIALDGIRGVMTLFVLISHFFGELPGGFNAIKVGWVAVDFFFVMSGFLIGRLILDRKDAENFFTVFYVRRAFRTLPSYFIVVGCVLAIFVFATERPWMEIDRTVPLWSYWVFAQNIIMAQTSSIGSHWLAPTWTLALEEHFYLLGPALIIFCPRRMLVPTLLALIAASLTFKAMIMTGALPLPKFYMYSTLPGRADTLLIGVVLAWMVKENRVDWPRFQLPIRLTPLVSLGLVALVHQSGQALLIETLTHFIVGVGSAAFLLMMVMDAPEAETCKAPWLRWCGDNSYSIYLTHLPVLGLCHGLMLGRVAEIGDWRGIAVTLVALPITLVVANLLTRFVEFPLSAYGRTWRWKMPARAHGHAAAAT